MPKASNGNLRKVIQVQMLSWTTYWRGGLGFGMENFLPLWMAFYTVMLSAYEAPRALTHRIKTRIKVPQKHFYPKWKIREIQVWGLSEILNFQVQTQLNSFPRLFVPLSPLFLLSHRPRVHEKPIQSWTQRCKPASIQHITPINLKHRGIGFR